ncbi:MAG: S8 family peptidase [Muribaculaceae bacterium]|nr:S8 family peptidase [Muribaculaceae bacterium]
MNKFLLLLISIFSVFTVYAGGDTDFEVTDDATHIPAMILADSDDLDAIIADLESRGIVVLRHRGRILLTYIPVNYSKDSRRIRGVRKIEYSKPRINVPTMKEARNFNNANLIAEGQSLPQPYDGKGVVVGVCDIGIDTQHPNFLDPDDGTCRIRRVVHYEELKGKRTVYATAQEISAWQTDNEDDWHATHVTGIAAGGHKESGYQSLAPKADIVFTASHLSDVGLLAGVEDIIEYARQQRKPAVINLSMGSYVGPHDGSSLFCQYLDMCASDAVICLSAGNEGSGGAPRSLSYDFTAEKPELRVVTCDYGGTDVAGEVEVWSADNEPFDFSLYLKSQSGMSKNIDPFPTVRFDNDGLTEWRISADKGDPDYNPTLATYYTGGYVALEGGVSPLNGRYYVNLQLELQTDIYHYDGDIKRGWAEYWPGIKVTGTPGSHIDTYCYGADFRLHGETGYPKPDNAQCISDLATGKRTISVGMMNNYELTAGAAPGSGRAKGDISVNSSYGTLNDGRKLPVTVAPGDYIISSISSRYLDKNPDWLQYTDDKSDYNGKTYYWIGTDGTSMSSPFVAGAIATWLQAYPALTADEALDIVLKTNRTSGYPDPENPRHGMGWFNAYAGLGQVLELAALKAPTIESPEVTVKYENGCLLIGNPTGEAVTISIYSPTGTRVERTGIGATLESYSLSHLGKGVYLVKIEETKGKSQTLKIVI